MRFTIWLIAFLVLTGFKNSCGQDVITVTWNQLGDIRFEESYDEGSGEFYQKPVFGPMIQAFEGSEIKITGYVIPMDIDLNAYVVSRFPFSSCFFCGNAGPETVVDLQMGDQSRSFKNDERRSFCGRLRLNTGRFFALPYILEDCKVCD